MKVLTRRSVSKLAIALSAVLCFGALGLPAQGPADVQVEQVYLAKDDGSGFAGEAATVFLPTDIPLYCVVILSSIEPVQVKMNFVASAVPGVKAETRVVSAAYRTKDGQNRVNFTGRPDRVWTAGKYRVDIFVNDKFAAKSEFEVREAARMIEPAKMLAPRAKPAKRRRN